MLQRLFGRGFGARSALRAARNGSQADGQTVIVHRVRFYRQRNFARDLFISTCVGYTCWHLYSSTVISRIEQHLEQEVASLTPKERKELEKQMAEEDASIFVAFPFTTKKVDSVAYKASDPEWKKFGEISKDKALQETIRNDLADLVKRAVSKHPVLKARIGNNMVLRRFWLDIDFPYRPAPTYEHSGILIDDAGISWASEPIDSLTVNRMNKILWPTAMAQSSWAFTTTMMQQHWAEVKRSLGFSSGSGSSSSPIFTPSLPRSSLPAPGRQTPDGTPADTAADNTLNKTASVRQPSEAESGGRTSFLKDMAMSHVEGSREMSNGAWDAFRRKLAQTWKPTRDFPPRGAVMVSGFVEMETSKGFVVIDVWAHWDPKSKTFDQRSILMSVRRTQLKVQTPARR